jgi:hypothetical protein
VSTTSTSTLPLESQRADAEQVLEILSRWDRRMRGRQTQKRSQERCAYSARMTLYHHGIKSKTRQGQETETAPIAVWARNVSLEGVGFIYKGQIRSKHVVLCLNPDAGATTWLRAEIVRSRQVHNEFWDYGAKFVGRATSEEAQGPPPQR